MLKKGNEDVVNGTTLADNTGNKNFTVVIVIVDGRFSGVISDISGIATDNLYHIPVVPLEGTSPIYEESTWVEEVPDNSEDKVFENFVIPGPSEEEKNI